MLPPEFVKNAIQAMFTADVVQRHSETIAANPELSKVVAGLRQSVDKMMATLTEAQQDYLLEQYARETSELKQNHPRPPQKAA